MLLNLAIIISAFHCYICIQKVWLLALRILLRQCSLCPTAYCKVMTCGGGSIATVYALGLPLLISYCCVDWCTHVKVVSSRIQLP